MVYRLGQIEIVQRCFCLANLALRSRMWPRCWWLDIIASLVLLSASLGTVQW